MKSSNLVTVLNRSNKLLSPRPEAYRPKPCGLEFADALRDRFSTMGRIAEALRFSRIAAALFIVTTLPTACNLQLSAQEVTSYAPTPHQPAASTWQRAGSGENYPEAVAVGPSRQGDLVGIESDRQSERDKVYTLDGAVDITYRDREVRADHVEYDANTGEVTATGHVVLTGGRNHERIAASQGNFNLKSETGRFYDVNGEVGMAPAHEGTVAKIYQNGNPFLFTGKVVVKTGPESYDIYEGSVTSCLLPKPDWLLTATHFAVAEGEAKGYNSTFHLLGLPLLWFPYVTHPTDPGTRQSGFMIPSLGESSTKGITLEEQFYLVLNRSMDLTIGAAYYSSIGWAQSATFRYQGDGLDFVKFHYTGLLDKRAPAANQGGEDAVLALRHDFASDTRLASNLEYLSSYIYREAFTDNFNQAVTSDILSTAYVTHETRGYEFAILADRYQGIKLIAQGSSSEQQVHILHTPTASLATTERRLGTTGLEWSLETSVSGLKRTQPNFASGGVVERVDLHPEVSLPFSLGTWRLIPTLGLEETAYSRSQVPTTTISQSPQQRLSGLSRSDAHFQFEVRSPILGRTFTPSRWTGLLGTKLRHTVEAETTYRVTKGVDNFRKVLRFDATDVVANTDEVEYGLTQRLFRRRSSERPCVEQRDQPIAASLPDAPDAAEMEGGLNPDPTLSVGNEEGADASRDSCQVDELISWRLTQKYFMDPHFGGAIVNGRRNIFDTTLSLSGVAFLTEPRNISPLISRLRLRSSAHTDVEWDFDYDTGAKKFTSSNLFLDLHAQNGLFGALSYARLDAPGRFYTESISSTTTTGVTTSISNFDQLRLLVGFGSPVKPGLSVAGNTGLDLKSLYGATGTTTSSLTGVVSTTTVYPALMQYATVQTNYNWNCCGVSFEYRKFELGSVRNEGSYKFNLTLANIGTAGNLRKAERLF
jgi:LPS-assembly protein